MVKPATFSLAKTKSGLVEISIDNNSAKVYKAGKMFSYSNFRRHKDNVTVVNVFHS